MPVAIDGVVNLLEPSRKMQKLKFVCTLCALLVMPLTSMAGFEEGEAANRKGDRATAFTEYREGAEAGDTRAFGKLGSMYLYGLGTERNYTLAYVWFALSEESGDKTGERYKRTAASVLTYVQVGEAEKLLDEYRERLGLEKPETGRRPSPGKQ